MSTVLVSLEEYLNTAYSPDREYVDGVVVERHAGEFPHSQVQSNFVHYLRARYPHWFALPEQRVRTVAGRRSRIPDVCLMVDRPESDVLDTPPLIAAEVLSKRDEVSDVLEKLAEYAAFGIPNIWVVEPRRRKAYTYQRGRLEEVTGEALTVESHSIRLPLAEIFFGL